MAEIFKIGNDSKVPDLSKIKSVLDIPEMEFESIDKALDSYTAFETTDIKNSEENFSKLVEHRDTVTNEVFGNIGEKERFEAARKDIGLDFSMSMDDLKDPYKIRGVSSKVGQLYERNDVKQVFYDKAVSDEFLKKAISYKDQNPGLYKMALDQYNRYANNEITGRELLAQDYEPKDYKKIANEAVNMLPEIITSELIDENGIVSVEKTTQRLERDVKFMVDAVKNNSNMWNNSVADNGGEKAAEEFWTNFFRAKIGKSMEISLVKLKSAGEATKPNIREMIIKAGGNPTGLTDFEAKAIGDNYKSRQPVDEGVEVTYGKGADINTIVFPYINKGGSDPIKSNGKTTVSMFGRDIELTNEIDGKSALTGSGVSSGTITKIVEHEGKKYLITNDEEVKNNIPKDKKLKEIGDKNIDDRYNLFAIGVDSEDDIDANELNEAIGAGLDKGDSEGFAIVEYTPPKTSVDFLNVSEDVKKEVEKQLDRNPYIRKNYKKGSQKYKDAAKFVSDRKLQDGFYYDVYVPEILDKGVANLPNTKTSRGLSSNQLRYLVHHQGPGGAKYYANNNGEIDPETIKKANKTGKKDANGEPIYRKKGDKGFRDIPKELRDALAKIGPGEENFEKFKEIVESGGKHILATPMENSSALGIHQVLFDSHYKKIKEYMDNIDNELYEHYKGPTVDTPTETPADTTGGKKPNFYEQN